MNKLIEQKLTLLYFTFSIQVLTPMQSAKVLTSCRPLVPHLPEVLNRLLHGDVSQKPAGSEVFVITDANDSAGSEKTTDNQ